MNEQVQKSERDGSRGCVQRQLRAVIKQPYKWIKAVASKLN